MLKSENFKITGKSFIMRIGTNAGSVGSCSIGADAKLRMLASITDVMMSENPVTDARDGKYRLYTAALLNVVYDENRIYSVIPSLLIPKTINTHVGQERIPGRLLAPIISGISLPAGFYFLNHNVVFTPPSLNVDTVFFNKINDKSYSFGWRATGRPAMQAEPIFQAVCLRRSRFIWHRIFGNINLVNGKIFVNARISGSEFPSHRAYVNGKITEHIKQGPFSNLWIGAATNPSRVNEVPLIQEIFYEAGI